MKQFKDGLKFMSFCKASGIDSLETLAFKIVENGKLNDFADLLESFKVSNLKKKETIITQCDDNISEAKSEIKDNGQEFIRDLSSIAKLHKLNTLKNKIDFLSDCDESDYTNNKIAEATIEIHDMVKQKEVSFDNLFNGDK